MCLELTKGRKEEVEKSLRRIYHEMYVQEQITAFSMEIAQSSSSAKEMTISDLFTLAGDTDSVCNNFSFAKANNKQLAIL